jgi:hypothetical protein
LEQLARLILWFLFGALCLVLISSLSLWWFEALRRLNRALTRTLGKPADAVVYDISGTHCAGLDFTRGDLAILWQGGAYGLVFSFDEIEGAELIVNEKIVARAQRGETRRVLDEGFAHASRVVLRLMFDDVKTPEFELELYGKITTHPLHAKTAAEAVRQGRKWLSHIDAVIKQRSGPSAYKAPHLADEQRAAPKHDTNTTSVEELPF